MYLRTLIFRSGGLLLEFALRGDVTERKQRTIAHGYCKAGRDLGCRKGGMAAAISKVVVRLVLQPYSPLRSLR